MSDRRGVAWDVGLGSCGTQTEVSTVYILATNIPLLEAIHICPQPNSSRTAAARPCACPRNFVSKAPKFMCADNADILKELGMKKDGRMLIEIGRAHV